MYCRESSWFKKSYNGDIQRLNDRDTRIEERPVYIKVRGKNCLELIIACLDSDGNSRLTAAEESLIST